MSTITLYTKPNCPLCDHTRHYLETLHAEQPDRAAWAVEEISILDDQDLYAAYRYLIPVVVVGAGQPIVAPDSLDLNKLRQALRAPLPAAPLAAPAPTLAAAPAPVAPPAPPYPYYPGTQLTGLAAAMDRAGNALTKHWLAGLNTLVGVFSTLPWLAPIFAHLGWWGLADPIYTVYMFFCHQLPERAGSLFGYQVAYCYRNTAIYSTIFFMGLLYAVARGGGLGGRLAWMRRPLGWSTFLLLLLPLLIDGLSHMLGFREDNAWFDALTGGRFGDFSVGDSVGTLNWWLRVITGTIFGFAVVRLLYPWVQIAFEESRRRIVWLPQPPERPLDGPRPAVIA